MHNDHDDAMNGQGPTPRAAPVQDQWSMTPSMLDTTSFAFSSLANQPSAYYGLPSPTSSTLPSTVPSHTQQSVEYPTPSMGMNLIAPIMNPPQTSVDPSTISNPAIAMNALHAPFVSQVGNGLSPYAQHSFAPNPTFSNSNGAVDPRPETDSSFGNYELSPVGLENSGPQAAEGVPDIGGNNNDDGYVGSPFEIPAKEHACQDANTAPSLRFDVLLRAPTAMVKNPHDIPVTYLNKGQAYAITVTDTAAMADPTSRPLRYRTFIRVSFEEEEQRSKPDSCWVLWQEGRGTNEAHHRNGKMLAVEHVDPNQGGNGESRHPQIQLDCANFDGFAVTWTPNKSNGRFECTISVRFNFLSTDFSHSKGVKGIPVRLCAKTEVVATTEGPYPSVPEVSYCKVKLFRDHGAERKLSNDSLHVRKMIDKVKMQIAQAELGAGQGGDKRKRNNSISGKGGIKPSKQKRSFSIAHGDSSRPSLEDDLQTKRDGLELMLYSARKASHLNLRGDPQDDPDMFPVKLETKNMAAKSFDWESSRDANGMSRSYSPSSSHHSIASRNSDAMRPPIFAYGNSRTGSSRPVSADWSNFSHQDSDGSRFSQTMANPVKVQRVCDSEGPFEALGVDPTYITPLDATKVPSMILPYPSFFFV